MQTCGCALVVAFGGPFGVDVVFQVAKAFGDRPLDGWYLLETESGGKVVVPYRKGEGALVFAKVKGAKVDDGKWSEGAKLWARENEAFMILGGFFVVFLVRKGWENRTRFRF